MSCHRVHLLLCEILVLAPIISSKNSDNIALGKPASQSTTWLDWGAGRAVDGNLDLDGITGNSCTHTEVNKLSPWWMVSLQQKYTVSAITLYNRIHGGHGGHCRDSLKYIHDWNDWNRARNQCESHDVCMFRDEPMPGGYHCYATDLYDRLSDSEIRVGDHKDFRRNALCYKIGKWPKEKTNQTFKCHQPLAGHYVSIERKNITGILTICEAQIHGVRVKDEVAKSVNGQNIASDGPRLSQQKVQKRWTPETVDFEKLHKRDKGVASDNLYWKSSASRVPQHLLYLILILNIIRSSRIHLTIII